MRLDQFDKLTHLVEKLIASHREDKFRLVRLEKENMQLSQKLEEYRNIPPDINEAFLSDVLTENERLKNKNQTVQKELSTIVAQLESRINRQLNGVDS